jgi:ribonuclease HI
MNKLVIYTDGACKGNPGPGGYGVVIIFENGENSEVVELGGFKPLTTNNQMELLAIKVALEYAQPLNCPIILHSDSQYSIKGITEWSFGWIKKGWKTANGSDVKNKEEFQALLVLKNSAKYPITFKYVKAHVGIPLNERADQIACEFAQQQALIDLYSGDLKDYPYNK